MSLSHLIGERVAASLCFGLTIGLERQAKQSRAGLRTNALVCLGATLFELTAQVPGADPSGAARVAGQIVTGIGFLGAGVIYREGLSVHGLNTAATLWTTAAVGVLCGMGQFALAGVGVVAILVSNLALMPVASWVNRHTVMKSELPHRYQLEFRCAAAEITRIRQLLLRSFHPAALPLKSITVEPVSDLESQVLLCAVFEAVGEATAEIESLMSTVTAEPGVLAGQWEAVAPKS